jgi:uncharacterized protein
MSDLWWYQYALIALIFVWSGFVRSGLGFGGAALSLPFLLLVHNVPLVYLPIIAVQLLLFSSYTVLRNNRGPSSATAQPAASTVDWPNLRRALAIMMVPKLIGIFGLITLPPALMSGIIFCAISVYAVSYLLNRPFRSRSQVLDVLFLGLGGYMSGISLIGAPLIIAVLANRIAKEQLRDTLFVLWFILVTIKMAAFVYAEVDLQLVHQLWLLPCAAVGHVIGQRFHQRMLQMETSTFFRWLGGVLLLTNALGLWKALTDQH